MRKFIVRIISFLMAFMMLMSMDGVFVLAEPVSENGCKDVVSENSLYRENTIEGDVQLQKNNISIGWRHSAVVTEKGELYLWGSNQYGELGNGSKIDSVEPIKVMDNVAYVCLGSDYSAAITNDGSLYMWGRNTWGQLGDGTTTEHHTPIKVMDNVARISLGIWHSAAITKDGSLYMWGRNAWGELGDGTTTDRYTPVKIMDNVAEVSLGQSNYGAHSAAITKERNLYLWGPNEDGELGNGTIGTSKGSTKPIKIMENVSSVSLGGNHSAAITNDGNLYMWGYNEDGEICNNGQKVNVKPIKIMENVSMVSLGGDHSAAITDDGSLYLWGDNDCGKLGNGTTENSAVPVKVMEDVSTVTLSGSYWGAHSAAMKKNGSLYMWGLNDYGQLGDGTTTDRLTPTKIMDNVYSFSGGSNNTSSALDQEILNKVSLYTSIDGSAYTQAVTKLISRLEEGNYTQEEKYQIMNRFWVGLGYSDIQEGIQYCHDATNARRAYDYLVSNEPYAAYQYWYWLNCTKKGNVTRGLLWADSWIFNNEIGQFMDINTYLTAETHSIKGYKAMLLDFMSYKEENIEFLSYANNLKKIVDVTADVGSSEIRERCIKDLTSAKTVEEANAAFSNFQKQLKVEMSQGGTTTKDVVVEVRGYDEIKEITKYSGMTIDILNNFTEDLTAFAMLETKLEMLADYESFLDSILMGQDVLPFDMVVAAAQLKKELEQDPLVTKLHTITAQVLDFVSSDNVLDLKGYMKEQTGISSGATMGDAIATIKLGAFITDLITGIGSTVDESRYVEGYAYLGMYYSTLLMESKEEFLKNKSVENAWKFYDTYQLLFRIRYMGENAYLEMNKADGIMGILIDKGDWNFFGIKDKQKFVQQTFEYLNNYCTFDLDNASEIGSDHYYEQKAVIKCPVNVEVYNEQKKLVYTIYDGREVDEINELGRFVCKYDAALGEYVKVVYLNDSDNYQVLLKGIGVGDVTVETTKKAGEDTQTAQIAGVPIEVGGTITLDLTSNQYVLDKDGNGEEELSGTLTETNADERQLITELKFSENEIRLSVGEKAALGVNIVPANASCCDLEWRSSNPNVAEVNNGRIIAKSKGNAIITAIAKDGTGVKTTCKVIVSSTTDIPKEPDTWVGKTGTEGFVYRLYNIALGREAEEAGFNDWNGKLKRKERTAAEVAYGFIFSDEFKNHAYNDAQFVKLLYRTMFGREADEGGMNDWLDALANGMSREYVFKGFVESVEFSNLCNSYGIERGRITLSAYRDHNRGATGFIARLYTKMLGRKYEDDGLEYWCRMYLTGSKSIEAIASDGFLHSQELANQKLSNEEFVKRMYETFLDREPEEAGLKDWVHRLETGEVTRDTLVYGFTNSKEFANIKTEYGL